jgi:hypothetical protein
MGNGEFFDQIHSGGRGSNSINIMHVRNDCEGWCTNPSFVLILPDSSIKGKLAVKLSLRRKAGEAQLVPESW